MPQPCSLHLPTPHGCSWDVHAWSVKMNLQTGKPCHSFSTAEAEAGTTRVWGQPGLHSKILPQTIKQQNTQSNKQCLILYIHICMYFKNFSVENIYNEKIDIKYILQFWSFLLYDWSDCSQRYMLYIVCCFSYCLKNHQVWVLTFFFGDLVCVSWNNELAL